MKKRRLVTTAAATFGAAMTSMYAAPELQADIVDLTFTPGSKAFNSTLEAILLDQVGASFSQWNDSVGKTLYAGSLIGVGIVNASSILNAGTFVGASSINAAAGFSTAATGTAFVGFSFGGNVGWFSLNLGGAGGAITYLGGQYGNAGESVHVGGAVIPEPTSMAALGVLALGAVGVRRNRKK